jgi:hypothetical protein
MARSGEFPGPTGLGPRRRPMVWADLNTSGNLWVFPGCFGRCVPTSRPLLLAAAGAHGHDCDLRRSAGAGAGPLARVIVLFVLSLSTWLPGVSPCSSIPLLSLPCSHSLRFPTNVDAWACLDTESVHQLCTVNIMQHCINFIFIW